MMNRVTPISTLLLLAASGIVASGQTDGMEAAWDSQVGRLQDSLPGTLNLDNRLRYEIFDLENGSPYRAGFSNRIRYGYTQAFGEAFSAMVEGETLFAIGGKEDIHPADAAGTGTELNQLWLGYADELYGKAKLGRQVYTLDDHRFIGHVGWRQNIQTFDAVTGAYTGLPGLALNGFYIGQVNTVTGAHQDLEAYGFNGAYAFGPQFKAIAFFYEMEGNDIPAQSNRTFGLRGTGSQDISGTQVAWALGFASQSDNGQSHAAFDANYWMGDLALTWGGITWGGGFEILEPGFRTPLATLHKFNGFADVFLGASGTGIPHGLIDLYLSAGFKVPLGQDRKLPIKFIYHHFDPESGPGDYGQELDAVLSHAFNKYLTGILKYGSYSSRGGSGGVGGADKTLFTTEVNVVF